MVTPIGSIIRAATREPQAPLNVLTFNAHERYQSFICKTGHNFYALRGEKYMEWTDAYAPVPNNYTMLPRNMSIPIDIELDIVFCPARVHLPDMQKIARMLHLPLLYLEVFIPNPKIQSSGLLKMKQESASVDMTVFLNQHGVKVWGWTGEEKNHMIIPHGIDTKEFAFGNEMRLPRIISSVNEWVKRSWSHGFDLWKELTLGLPKVVTGNNPGLSTALSLPDLIKEYQRSRIFLNTTQYVSIPTALLEAMACGCVPVTTNTGGMSDFVINGVNGFISNDKEELRSSLEKLLEDEALASQMGAAARQTIIDKFNIVDFTLRWDKLLRDTSQITYIGK
jgi:hypothetical protein